MRRWPRSSDATTMKSYWLKLLVIALLMVPISGSALDERYVSPTGSDRDDGSLKHPWATIQHAALAVKPGMTVHVLPGTYLGPIRTRISGTETAPIRFISDRKW